MTFGNNAWIEIYRVSPPQQGQVQPPPPVQQPAQPPMQQPGVSQSEAAPPPSYNAEAPSEAPPAYNPQAPSEGDGAAPPPAYGQVMSTNGGPPGYQ